MIFCSNLRLLRSRSISVSISMRSRIRDAVLPRISGRFPPLLRAMAKTSANSRISSICHLAANSARRASSGIRLPRPFSIRSISLVMRAFSPNWNCISRRHSRKAFSAEYPALSAVMMAASAS